MKLSDRIAEFKAQATNTPEGKKKAIKLGAAAASILLALVVVAVRLMGSSAKPEGDRTVTPQLATQVETMAKEMEQAQEEEDEAFGQAIAAGEVEPPAPQERSNRPHGPKGVGYTPGFDPSTYREPTPAPAPEPEPEPEQPEDPG